MNPQDISHSFFQHVSHVLPAFSIFTRVFYFKMPIIEKHKAVSTRNHTIFQAQLLEKISVHDYLQIIVRSLILQTRLHAVQTP